MCKLESYVKVLEAIIVEILLPKYNQFLVKSGEKSTNLNRLVVDYRDQQSAALLRPKLGEKL